MAGRLYNLKSGYISASDVDGSTASAEEINVLDGVTAGTVAASKGVVADANKDVTGFRNVTATGTVQANTAVKADTVSEKTADAGVTVDGVLLKDGTVKGAHDIAADGLGVLGVARFTFDAGVAANQPIGAHGTGVTLPANAVVVGGFYEVNTAFTSAGGNAGTVAISVNAANDLVTATAVSNAIYGTTGLKAIVPKSNTPESTGIKCATAKEVTATVAGQALTAGKLTGFLYYVVSAATA